MLLSGPSVDHPQSELTVHCAWFTCCTYWCDHMSGAISAGSAL